MGNIIQPPRDKERIEASNPNNPEKIKKTRSFFEKNLMNDAAKHIRNIIIPIFPNRTALVKPSARPIVWDCSMEIKPAIIAPTAIPYIIERGCIPIL